MCLRSQAGFWKAVVIAAGIPVEWTTLLRAKPIPFAKLALIKRFRVVDPDEMDDEENLHINDDDEMMSSV